jgi:hypothetical protein
MSIVDVKKAGARPEGAFWHGTSVHGDLRAMTLGSGHATGAPTGMQQFFFNLWVYTTIAGCKKQCIELTLKCLWKDKSVEAG